MVNPISGVKIVENRSLLGPIEEGQTSSTPFKPAEEDTSGSAKALSKLVLGQKGVQKRKEDDSFSLSFAQTILFFPGLAPRPYGRGFITREEGKIIGTLIFPNGGRLQFEGKETTGPRPLEIERSSYQVAPEVQPYSVPVKMVEGKTFQWTFQMSGKTALTLELEKQVNTGDAKIGTRWVFKQDQPGIAGDPNFFAATSSIRPEDLKVIGLFPYSRASLSDRDGTMEQYEIILNNGDSVSFQVITDHHGKGEIAVKNAFLYRLVDQDPKRKTPIHNITIKNNTIILKCNGSLLIEIPVVPPGRGQKELKMPSPDAVRVKAVETKKTNGSKEHPRQAFVVSEEELEKLAKLSHQPYPFLLREIYNGKQFLIDLYHDGKRWVPVAKNGVAQIMIGSEGNYNLEEATVREEETSLTLAWNDENGTPQRLFFQTDGYNIALQTDRDLRRDVRKLWEKQDLQIEEFKAKAIEESPITEPGVEIISVTPESRPVVERFPGNQLFLPVAKTRELLKREPAVLNDEKPPRETFKFLASPQPPGTSGLAADYHQYRADIEMEWNPKLRKWIPAHKGGNALINIKHYTGPQTSDWEEDFPCELKEELGEYSLMYGDKQLRFFESDVGVYIGLSGAVRNLADDRRALASLEAVTKGESRMRSVSLPVEGGRREYVVDHFRTEGLVSYVGMNLTFSPVELEGISPDIDLEIAPHPNERDGYLLKVKLPIENGVNGVSSELEVLYRFNLKGWGIEPLAWVDGLLYSNVELTTSPNLNRTGLKINGTPHGDIAVTLEQDEKQLRIVSVRSDKQIFTKASATVDKRALLEQLKTVEGTPIVLPGQAKATKVEATLQGGQSQAPLKLPKSKFRASKILLEHPSSAIPISGLRHLFVSPDGRYNISFDSVSGSWEVVGGSYQFPGMDHSGEIGFKRQGDSARGKLGLYLKGPYEGVTFFREGNYLHEISDSKLRLEKESHVVALPPEARVSPEKLKIPSKPVPPEIPVIAKEERVPDYGLRLGKDSKIGQSEIRKKDPTSGEEKTVYHSFYIRGPNRELAIDVYYANNQAKIDTTAVAFAEYSFHGVQGVVKVQVIKVERGKRAILELEGPYKGVRFMVDILRRGLIEVSDPKIREKATRALGKSPILYQLQTEAQLKRGDEIAQLQKVLEEKLGFEKGIEPPVVPPAPVAPPNPAASQQRLVMWNQRMRDEVSGELIRGGLVSKELELDGNLQTIQVHQYSFHTSDESHQIELFKLSHTHRLVQASYKFPGMKDWGEVEIKREDRKNYLTLKGPYEGVEFIREEGGKLAEISDPSLRIEIEKKLMAIPALPEERKIPAEAPAPSPPLPVLETKPPMQVEIASRLTPLLLEASADPSSDFFMIISRMTQVLQMVKDPKSLEQMNQILTLLEKPATRGAGLNIAKILFGGEGMKLYGGLAFFDPDFWTSGFQGFKVIGDGIKDFANSHPQAAEFGGGAFVFGAADISSDIAMAMMTNDWSKFKNYSIADLTKLYTALSLGGAIGKQAVSRWASIPGGTAWSASLKRVGIGRGVPLMTALLAAQIAEGKIPSPKGLALTAGNIALASGTVYVAGLGAQWAKKTSIARFLGRAIQIPFMMATPAAVATTPATGGASLLIKEIVKGAVEFFILKGLGKAEEKFFQWKRDGEVEKIKQTMQDLTDGEAVIRRQWNHGSGVDTQQFMNHELHLLGMNEGLDQMLEALEDERELEIQNRILDIPADYYHEFVVDGLPRFQYSRNPETVDQVKREVHALYDSLEIQLKVMKADMKYLIEDHNQWTKSQLLASNGL